jgi:hypothetical protein
VTVPAASEDPAERPNSGERESSRQNDYSSDAATELVSRLRVIEEQPLGTRAAAYASVHEELAKRLESAPADERA